MELLVASGLSKDYAYWAFSCRKAGTAWPCRLCRPELDMHALGRGTEVAWLPQDLTHKSLIETVMSISVQQHHSQQDNCTCLALPSCKGLLSRSAAGTSAFAASSASAPDFLGLRRLQDPLLRSAFAVFAAMLGAVLPSPSSELCSWAFRQPVASPEEYKSQLYGRRA